MVWQGSNMVEGLRLDSFMVYVEEFLHNHSQISATLRVNLVVIVNYDGTELIPESSTWQSVAPLMHFGISLQK